METLVFDTAAIFNFGHRDDLTPFLKNLSGCYSLLTTPGVIAELTDPDRQPFYDTLLATWFTIQSTASTPFDIHTLAHLSQTIDPGEISVMALAKELKATAVLDEKSARREAGRLGLKITGTLGLMRQAVSNKWMTEPECLARIICLCDTGFNIPRPAPHHTLADYLQIFR